MRKDEWPYKPNTIQIELVQGCNRKCRFCGTRGIERGIHLAEPDTVLYACRLIKEAGLGSRILLAGHGEPTLHPKLVQIVRSIRETLPKNMIHLMENSHQHGYKRLNRAIKAPIIHEMREYAHGLGMRFHVSDAFCRECNDACNCCGVPPEWGVSQRGNIGQAIITARERGEVHFSDVQGGIEQYFSFPWCGAAGYNTGSNKARALNYDTTVAQYLRDNWNNPNKGTSPAKGYGGILKPIGRDKNGDVVYKYALKGEEDNGEMERS